MIHTQLRLHALRLPWTRTIRRFAGSTPNLVPPRPVTLSSLINDNYAQRALDRSHRSLSAHLRRSQDRYGASETALGLNLANLLVVVQNDVQNGSLNIRLKTPLPSKKQHMLEPLVFVHILVLHQIANKNNYDPQVLPFLNNLITKIIKSNKPTRIKDTDETTNNATDFSAIDAAAFINTLVMTSPPSTHSLVQALHAFQLVSSKYFHSNYTQKHLSAWILSLTAPSVRLSCEHLRNHVQIPPFVLADVLLRTPMCKQDLELQLDLWAQFRKQIVTAFTHRPRHLKAIISNLFFYHIVYDSRSLPELVISVFGFLASPKAGCTIKELGVSFLNRTIWDIGCSSTIRTSATSMKSVVKAQEMLVSYVAMQGSEKAEKAKKVHQKLDLKAHMGVVLAIHTMSPDKAAQLMSVAERRFFVPDQTVGSKDMIAYNITKTFLASNPQQLVETFNNYAVENSHSSVLWLSFIKRLAQLGLLSQTRSLKIVAELVKLKAKVIVSKDILSLLIQPIKGLNSLDTFITSISAIGPHFVTAHSSSILPKYLTMLYQNHGSNNLAENYYSWDTKPSTKIPGTYKGFASVEAYARHVYYNCIKKKTPRVIGTMLQGEAIIAPQGVYDLYRKELKTHSVSPDSGCILALIRASMKPSATETCIMWGNLYAPQIAIHEFVAHVKHDLNDTKNIVPDNNLWQNYIRMLVKYEYVYELSEIMHWWERLHFNPKYSTLKLLLASLPEDHTKRYISHIEKLRKDSIQGIEPNDRGAWNWPTIEEVEAYKNKQKLS